MTKKHKCKKWNHDFSYKGKEFCKEIKCRHCGIGMIDWTEERVEERVEEYKKR
jgi:hypothetical protein